MIHISQSNLFCLQEDKVNAIDVSAVNDICNGTFIYKKKVLSKVWYYCPYHAQS